MGLILHGTLKKNSIIILSIILSIINNSEASLWNSFSHPHLDCEVHYKFFRDGKCNLPFLLMQTLMKIKIIIITRDDPTMASNNIAQKKGRNDSICKMDKKLLLCI